MLGLILLIIVICVRSSYKKLTLEEKQTFKSVFKARG